MCSVRPGSGFAFQDRRARDGDCSAAWNQRSETAGADPPALRRAPRCASARAPPSEINAEETHARSDRPRLAARPHWRSATPAAPLRGHRAPAPLAGKATTHHGGGDAQSAAGLPESQRPRRASGTEVRQDCGLALWRASRGRTPCPPNTRDCNFPT